MKTVAGRIESLRHAVGEPRNIWVVVSPDITAEEALADYCLRSGEHISMEEFLSRLGLDVNVIALRHVDRPEGQRESSWYVRRTP